MEDEQLGDSASSNQPSDVLLTIFRATALYTDREDDYVKKEKHEGLYRWGMLLEYLLYPGGSRRADGGVINGIPVMPENISMLVQPPKMTIVSSSGGLQLLQ